MLLLIFQADHLIQKVESASVEKADKLEKSERGKAGFGSTGHGLGTDINKIKKAINK